MAQEGTISRLQWDREDSVMRREGEILNRAWMDSKTM